jgi:hypothetical protein
VFLIWASTALVVIAWSAYLDFQFFRRVAATTSPGLYLVVQRAVSWSLIVLVFGGVSFWPGLLEEIGIK